MLSYGQGAQNLSNNMSKTCCLAKAKFDNFAESHDELAFRKGDVLTVVDQKIEGLEGWWLCSFRGKQGIVPANRVSLLAGLYHESALRFNTSPESSISDGGNATPDYDIPKQSVQNRKLPPVPAPAEQSRMGQQLPIRELVYDIPKSLEKTRVGAVKSSNSFAGSLQSAGAGVTPSGSTTPSSTDNVYDTLPTGAPVPLQVLPSSGSSAPGNRMSNTSCPISPLYRSADSAVDVRSNRSSLMSTTSSPPGSSVYDYHSGEVYDTPNIHLRSNASSVSRSKASSRISDISSTTLPPMGGENEQCYYDVPKTIRETLQNYRDSGIYDNNMRQPLQMSPQKDPLPGLHHDSRLANSSPVTLPFSNHSEVVYDTLPSKSNRKLGALSNQGSLQKMDSLDLNDIEKLSLNLDEAIEIVVKLQQHVHTSSNRLLSFVHSKWRLRANLESVLYDLKIACVGFQSTLQEFYEFGLGAVANSSSIADKTVMNRLCQVLVPLKNKLDVVNSCMKTLSGMKWHIAKLEKQPDKDDDHEIVRLVNVAREISEDVNRVASVIHGNSSLLFKSSQSDVQNLSSEIKESSDARLSSATSSTISLGRDQGNEVSNEYDYCDINVKPTEVSSNISPLHPNTDDRVALDLQLDSQYLCYYLQHIHSICNRVKEHKLNVEKTLDSKSEFNKQMLVRQSRELVATAHELVYIGDTLCRYIRSSHIQVAVSKAANSLCNVLKEYIMSVKDLVTATSKKSLAESLFNSLCSHVKGIQLQTQSFHDVVNTYCQ